RRAGLRVDRGEGRPGDHRRGEGGVRALLPVRRTAKHPDRSGRGVERWVWIKRKRRGSLRHLPTPNDYLPFVGGVSPGGSPTRRRRDPRIARGERDARVREMALAGAPGPAIAAAVGLSPTRVRQLCAELSPRKAGRPRDRRTSPGLGDGARHVLAKAADSA